MKNFARYFENMCPSPYVSTPLNMTSRVVVKLSGVEVLRDGFSKLNDFSEKCQVITILLLLLFTNNIFSQPSSPAAPIIDSVSVDPVSGLAVIGWTQNPNADVDKYKIFIYDPSQAPPWAELMTVNGGTSSYTVITGSSPSAGSETYGISAVDFSGASSFSLLSHQTIHLMHQYSNCNLEVDLKWNKYINWANGVKEYRILASENGGIYNQVGTTAPSDTIFKYPGLNPLSSYDFVIRAIEDNSSRTSSSNKISFTADYPKKPQFTYLKQVTVINDSEIELYCLVDTSAEVEKYIIQRADEAGNFITVSEIQAESLGTNEIKFTDSDVDAKNKKYNFRILAIDFCGNESASTQAGNSILLKGENDANSINNRIEWNDYINWEGNVSGYSIYRSINGVFDPAPITTVLPGVNYYEEKLDEFYESHGEFCYYIEATEGSGLVFNFQSKSNSNTICLIQRPFLYVPSAFNPTGINKVFSPVFSYVDPVNFSMKVFNRWGQLVFESTDPYTGWDGTVKGTFLPADNYVYYVTYSSALGTLHHKSGTVLLLR